MSGGNQAQASKVLSMERSHTGALNSSSSELWQHVKYCDNMCQHVSTREAHEKLNAQGSY